MDQKATTDGPLGDTYCGIYCGACSVLRHGEDGRGDAYSECCTSVPREELVCGGCKSGRVYPGCRVCKIRDCAVAKGVEHCVLCAEYPCSAYRKWRWATKLLPHLGECAANLEAIRRDGVNVWLAAQEQRWSCPNCGTRFSWYRGQCSGCGCSLAKETYAMSGVRRTICRMLLPALYRRGKLLASTQARDLDR